MESPGEVRCGRIGVFRVLGMQEGQSATEGQFEEASCVSCGDGISREGVELNEETVDVILKALLLEEEEVSKCQLWACVGCYSSLHSFLNLVRQLEELRVTFNDQRRRLGLHVVLRSLRKSQESYDGWLAALKSVEDVFPSEVSNRLKKTCDVAVGTDEVVKIEEEEDFFDIIACKVETETDEQNKVDEPHKIGDLGGDSAAGPSDEHLSERMVSLESTKSDVVAETGCKETKDSHSNVPTKRRRRSCVSKVDVVRPLSQVDTVEPARGNRRKSVVKSVDESQPSGLGTSTVDKTTVTSGGVCGDSLETQTVGRPRRAMRKRVRYAESYEDGSADEDSEFLPSDDEIVSDSENPEDAEFEEVGGTRQPESSVACKPLTMLRCVRQPKKRTYGNHYYCRCKFCPKAFKGYDTYRRHCYEDHKEDYLKDLPFACLVCYKVFSSAMALQVHKKKHESLKCAVCGKFFLGKRDFIEHSRTHTGEKPYACDVCHRKFAHSCSLKLHMRKRRHAGKKPLFACDVCDRKFSSGPYLKDHMNTHTGEKPFVCSCGEHFGQRYNMKKHKTTTGHS